MLLTFSSSLQGSPPTRVPGRQTDRQTGPEGRHGLSARERPWGFLRRVALSSGRRGGVLQALLCPSCPLRRGGCAELCQVPRCLALCSGTGMRSDLRKGGRSCKLKAGGFTLRLLVSKTFLVLHFTASFLLFPRATFYLNFFPYFVKEIP